MVSKTHLAEIKLSDFEAILAGLREVIQGEERNVVISRTIALMEEATTPEGREIMLDSIAAELEFSFPVAIIMQLGDETYKGFESRLTQLENGGWMGEAFTKAAPFIRLYLLDCETRGQKGQAVQVIKVIRSTFFLFRKALSLAGIQDNFETYLESAKEILAHQ